MEQPFGPDHGLRASTATLRHAVRTLRPAVVHSHLAYADIVAALVGGATLVSTEHGIARDDLVYHHSPARSRVMNTVHTARLRRFDAAIAVSHATADAMTEKWRPRLPVTVIPNGVDPTPHADREAGLRILSLARLAPEKRLDALVDAFAALHREHPEATLTLAGRGEGETALRAQVDRLGLSEVVSFPGFVDAEEAMADHDVLAMLSVWENCSYALLDAAARGLGVVASRVGGNPEMLPGRCLVDADDADAVAGALAAQGLDVAVRPGLDALAVHRRHVEAHRRGLRLRPDCLMKRVESPWNLPDARVDRARVVDREVRITDFLLFAVMPLRSIELSGFPLNELATGLLVALCLVRIPRGRGGFPPAAAAACVALLALLAFSGLANDVDWTRRVGHVAIWCGLIWAGATGRFSLRSAALGLATGLIGVIVHGAVTIGASAYSGPPHRLPGRPQRRRLLHRHARHAGDRLRRTPPSGGPLHRCPHRGRPGPLLLAHRPAGRWPTPSSGLSSAVASGLRGGIAMVVGLVWLVDNIPENLVESFGPFSNRSGSDALRDRIVAAERRSLADMPWFGHGPGTATIALGDQEFFFHNSYLAVRQEGGWIALGLVLFLLAYAFLRLSPWSRLGDLQAIAAQAALISVPVMAVTLGEVLLDTPAAIAIAFALGRAAELRQWHGTRTWR